jgi:crotonobetainyl-CoA:carnitine CoA-transferase CaiB-like acyl-CoA transferase
MAERLLAGLRVIDLAGEPGQWCGRILADLGAQVVKVEGPDGDPLRRFPHRFAALNAGKLAAPAGAPQHPSVAALLSGADVVVTTPGWPGAADVDSGLAPQAIWVEITPFGATGPRAGWRASDLGVMAATGNLYATGDADRPPVRCSEPVGYAHTGPEAAMAVLTALASGRRQRIDVSMQETVLIANIGAVGRFARTGFRGKRSGAATGRTREIWPCADGWVSFGLRGGRARLANLQTITRLVADAGLGTAALSERDWSSYQPSLLADDELRAIEAPIAAYFAQRTMAELYQTACQTNLMLAPANSPPELYASEQLAFRGFFGQTDGVKGLPLTFVHVRSPGDAVEQPRAANGAPPVTAEAPVWARRDPGPPFPLTLDKGTPAETTSAGAAWDGTRILEFGSGAAGPIATRYFAEYGATVIRVESRSRPDFLRAYALGPDNPHGLEGSDMFDALNAGKRSVTLNLKHPDGAALARRLVGWSDAISENFAPKAMRGLGLDYDSLVGAKPDLVMISACLLGQTGPHRDYPGFGGQGSALAGFNFLTGWPDRAPLGPHGTITDSLAPRFVACALAAGLLYQRRTGRGVYLDLSQVEAGAYTLAPWLLTYAATGEVLIRMGNRSDRAVPHGLFPCQGEDRWVAIACWTDEEWAKLAGLIGSPVSGTTPAERLAAVDEIEKAVSAWTSGSSAQEVAEELQGIGLEAVPVFDFGDAFADPQLHHRGHFVPLSHPFLGQGAYERNGFRLSDCPGGYQRPSPTLGQDNEWVLGEVLGLSSAQQSRLAEDGVLE